MNENFSLRRPEFRCEPVMLDSKWWAATTVVDGRDYDVAGVSMSYEGGTWVENKYLKGEFPMIGSITNGDTGKETLLGTIIPQSLIDPTILMNGKSMAEPQYEAAHLAFQTALDVHMAELRIYEATLAEQQKQQAFALIPGVEETLQQEILPQQIAA